MMDRTFMPGIELSRMFFEDAVEPLIAEALPELSYGAALIGSGSEVLGFDTEMSSDHHWGPRVLLFLEEADLRQHGKAIHQFLASRLPYTFRGYSTNFLPPEPEDSGTQLLSVIESGPVNHRVETLNLSAFCLGYLGVDPLLGLTPIDWLTIPGQKLRAMTAGAVFRDDHGELTNVRELLSEYPHDVWLTMMAAGWARVGQEEAFVGRAGIVGDELGSRVIASRLIHDLMNLCFLMEKQYPPYSKWFGTAFNELACADQIAPVLNAVFDAQDWQTREKHLSAAYRLLVEMFNKLKISNPLPAEVSSYHGRPFMVIHGDTFVTAIKEQIRDPELQRISSLTNIGAIEQFSTCTDVLSETDICQKLRQVYL